MREADQVRPPSLVTKAPLALSWPKLDATTVQVEALGHDRFTWPMERSGPEGVLMRPKPWDSLAGPGRDAQVLPPSAVSKNTGLPVAPTSQKAQSVTLEHATLLIGVPPLVGAGCQVLPRPG